VKRVLLAGAVLVAAGVLWIAFTLPPVRMALPHAEDDGTVAGVLHIHTNRSDGSGSPQDAAAAASRAGLKFIVLTDHGDATRTPDPPSYYGDVLTLDGVEISTAGGHYLAIGLPAAPYPLGGEPRDVVEDVARLGGFGVAAHPDSPKQELQWQGWSTPFDGIEVVNADTSWRVHATGGLRAKLRLLEALSGYPFRPAEAIARLLSDSSRVLARWETLTRVRRVVAVAGTDAHAQIGPVPIPSYESAFRMLSVRVKPEGQLSGNAARDAAAILRGLRAGHVYTAADGFAGPPLFEFSAVNSAGSAGQGDELLASGPVTLRVQSNAPPTFTTTVWRGDQILETDRHDGSLTVTAPEAPAVYRVEIHASDRRDRPLWIASNPIYVRGSMNASAAPGLAHPLAVETEPLFTGRNASAWRLERAASSTGEMHVVSSEEGKGELHVRYRLASDHSQDGRLALLVSFPRPLASYDRTAFSVRADRPMRISVQLRTEKAGVAEERWQRSVYADTTRRTRTLFFDDFVPMGESRHARPPLADMPYVMFVVDAASAGLGVSGEFWISDVSVQR